MPERIEMNLLLNAFDYLREAVERIAKAEPTPSDYKHAILNVVAAIELIFKQRLFDEHWSLVFANTSKANRSDLKSGKFKSLDFEELITRLESICDIDLKKHRKELTLLRDLRNQIQHFHVQMERGETLSLMLKGWSLLVDFIGSHIRMEENSEEADAYNRIVASMGLCREYVQHRHDVIKEPLQKKWSQDIKTLLCPVCLEEALPNEEGTMKCLFCNTEFTEDELIEKIKAVFDDRVLEDYVSNPAFFNTCPSCGMISLYEYPDEGGEPHSPLFVCLKCKNSWEWYEMRRCGYCGNFFETRGNGDQICDNCYREMSERDD